MSSLTLVPCSLDYCSFEVSFEMEKLSSAILFFLSTVLAILGSLNFHMSFRINLSISVKLGI